MSFERSCFEQLEKKHAAEDLAANKAMLQSLEGLAQAPEPKR